MRWVVLMLLLSAVACDVTGPGYDYSMTGTWTVQTYLAGGESEHNPWTGADYDYSFQCTGTATMTLVDTEHGITGTNVGALACVHDRVDHGTSSTWTTTLDMNGAVVGDRTMTSVNLQVSCYSASSTRLSYAGTLTSATAGNGTITGLPGDCGLGGTWSITRRSE